MSEREHTDLLKKLPMSAEDIRDIPLAYAKAVRTELQALPMEARANALATIRAWIRFTREKGILDTQDPFVAQFYLQEFARTFFEDVTELPLYKNVSLLNLNSSYRELLMRVLEKVSLDILHDKKVALRGGAARLALKMYAGVSIDKEIPLNDIDIVTTDPTSAERYGIDLAGAQIVHGNLEECVKRAIANVDCSMNEVAILNGSLVFSEQALEDAKTGTIRIRVKNDPLFGSEGVRYPRGEVYMNRTGFYRTLSLLLRGKGERILVSKENIEREIPTLGRYWLTLLFVKILRVGDSEKRDAAIRNWFLVAKELGATEAEVPEDFLKELIAQFPEMSERIEPATFTPEKQIRWIVGKFSGSVYSRVMQLDKTTDLPSAYTPTYIELPKETAPISLAGFWEAINQLSNAKEGKS